MLAGIKTGKRKKKAKEDPRSSAGATTQVTPRHDDVAVDANASVAEQLRKSLQGAKDIGTGSLDEAFRPRSSSRSLEERGRILPHDKKDSYKDDSSTLIVVPERVLPSTNDTDLTVAEMVAQERAERQSSMTNQERDARNILRYNKKRKLKTAVDDEDEEVHRQLQSLQQQQPGGNTSKAARRERSRQLARHDQQQSMSAKCWWWLESPQFARHRLLALGDYVSLVMAPPNLSLTPGRHFYLVPIAHAPSLTACDDHVWNEIRHFQSSLRRMFAGSVLFCETVLLSSNRGGCGCFWQTKLQCIVVPPSIAQEARLVFKAALTAQAQEWGTHQTLLSTTRARGLCRTIPPNFAYVYVEFGDDDCSGYAQMIEHRDFPADFCVDTLAGRMQMDPMRFRRRREKVDASIERQQIRAFLDQWKEYDWTLALDNDSKEGKTGREQAL